MKIENSDIDCMIDISVFLKELADHPEDCRHKKPFDVWHERLRKVYILLLNASEKGQTGIEHLIKKGVQNDSPIGETVKLLCPNIG
jgi:hypothetical protein